MLAFHSWAQRGSLLGRALRTGPGPGSLRAAGGQEGSGTGVTRDGLQPCVSWDRALYDSPDPAVLRCTGMLISTAALWHEGWLGCPQMPPPSGQVGCSCTAGGPRTVRPKEGQTNLRSDTECLSSNKCIGPQYWGLAQSPTGAWSLRSSLPAWSTLQ